MSLKESFFTDPFTVDESIYVPGQQEVIEKQAPTTRKELWGYYLYYNGDNGFTMFSFMSNILQSLPYSAGWDPRDPTRNTPCNQNDTTQPCNIPFGPNGANVPVASMILYVQAISFAVQFVLFTTFGGLADYGRWNTYILFASTLVGCVTQIIPAAFQDPSQWTAMMIVMILAWISYGASLVFYAAAFPPIADNLPIVRAARASTMTDDEKAAVTEKWHNHVSTISTTWSNIGYLLVTSILAAAGQASYQNVPAGSAPIIGNAPIFNNIATAFCGAFWVINAIWYFIWIPKGRQGPPIPSTSSVLTVGWKSIYISLKEVRRLRQAFLYIVAYFLFSDGINTIVSMIGIIQAQITSFNALQLTLLNLVSAISSIIGCIFFLWLQKKLGLNTKWALLIIIGATALIPLWGCFGIGFTTWGIRTKTELWVFYVWSGLVTAPIYAWQQTMLAELIPKGKEGLFFGLFGVVNKASSWIGPLVIGAITNVTSSVWDGWPFDLFLLVVPMVMIFFIDEKKARIDVAEYERIENEKLGRSASTEKASFKL